MINLTKDLTFKGYGRFPEFYLKKENFKDRIQELTTAYKTLGDLYLTKLGGDKKVTGSEKKELSNSIESILLYALLLKKVDFSPNESAIRITKQNDYFYTTLQFPSDLTWEINGAMRPEYVIKAQNFRDIFNGSLSEKMKHFLGSLSQALADKQLSAEELATLSGSVDKIILELLELFIFVERVMVFH